MRSPFPGMDPWIENQAWEDFHPRFLGDVADELVAALRPRYVVRSERRVYVERQGGGGGSIVADIGVARGRARRVPTRQATGSSAAPVELTLPMPEHRREVYLTIRERETLEMVSVIELLSPTNKRRGADGRREYLAKRATVLESPCHLVEIDLLRGGERLPMIERLPRGDYYAVVSRSERRPKAQVYGWSLRQPLPTIPIPLAGGDPDHPLELQRLFERRFERSGYDYSLDRDAPVDPPLSSSDAAWARRRLGG